MDYTIICDTIINYLIDKIIKSKENDTTIIKIEKFLLKYKRIISIVLLILLLYIGNQCNLSYLNINVNHKKEYVLNGGNDTGTPAGAAPAGAAAAGAAAAGAAPAGAAAAGAAPAAEKERNKKERAYDFGAKYANKFKDNSSVIYAFIYSIAITILMFLIFVPAVGFIVIGFICYALLKNRMKAIKGL